jgi:hypothetical protein
MLWPRKFPEISGKMPIFHSKMGVGGQGSIALANLQASNGVFLIFLCRICIINVDIHVSKLWVAAAAGVRGDALFPMANRKIFVVPF